MKDQFIEAIHSRRNVRVVFFSQEDDCNLTRTCSPMDYGPSRSPGILGDRYHVWDFESDQRPHPLPLAPDQVVSMEVLDEGFDPADFVTWPPNWHVDRDWGAYS